MRCGSSIFVILVSLVLPRSFSNYAIVPSDCRPQKTPLYGTKWCNFTMRANEIGARCWFKCSKGYALLGAMQNECVKTGKLKIPRFNPQQRGLCKRTTNLNPGEGGPYYLYTRFDDELQIMGVNDSIWVPTSTNSTLVKNPVGFNLHNPGLGVDGNTISLSLHDEPEKFLIFEDGALKFETSPDSLVEKETMKDWEQNATFTVSASLFFQGYSTLAPITWSHQSLMTNGTHVILGRPQDEETEKQSSFFISDSPLNITRKIIYNDDGSNIFGNDYDSSGNYNYEDYQYYGDAENEFPLQY